MNNDYNHFNINCAYFVWFAKENHLHDLVWYIQSYYFQFIIDGTETQGM